MSDALNIATKIYSIGGLKNNRNENWSIGVAPPTVK